MAALTDGFLIRTAVLADIPSVAAIESDVFPDPWPARLYLQEIGQPMRFQRVAVDEVERIVAYLFATWQVDELHILKVATHPCLQRRGLATALLEQARDEVIAQRGRGLILEVRPSNTHAIHLYGRHGYRLIARRPHYYSDGEDALVLYAPAPPRAVEDAGGGG